MDINLSSRAVEKLVDYTASGIGSVAGHVFARSKARRQADAERILAEGQADTMRIIAAAQAEARALMLSSDYTVRGEIEIGQAIDQRIQFQEAKRLSNTTAVVQQAALQLGDKEVLDIEPDHDWAARFFNEVQDVSSEGMQVLWAKVLTGQIERPGSVSLLTLDVLRNLDQSTALLFEKLCSTCLSIAPSGEPVVDARVPSLGGQAGDNALHKYGLGFLQLTTLNEHRLIISDFNSWFDYKPCLGITDEDYKSPLFYPVTIQGRHWLLTPTIYYTQSKDFKLHGVALTQSGKELLNVVVPAPNEEYLHDLMRFFTRWGIKMIEVENSEPQTMSNSRVH